MKRAISLALCIAITLVMGGFALAEGETITIGIIQYVQHVALDSAREGFIAALADNGYENVEFDIQNAQADASNLSTIADKFVNDKVDMVLAIATQAAQIMAGRTAEIPILGTAITDYVSAKLADSNEIPGGNVSGTSDMNPIAEQIAMIAELLPQAETIGILYTSSEDNSVLQARIAREAIEALGLACVEITVNNSNDVQQATLEMVTKCDAIYIPTDNVFASAMPIVYGVTVEAKMPVFCGETGMVASGGLATLGIDYYNLGYQTGLMAIRVLEGEDIATMPIETTTAYSYYFNKTVADEIGFEIPEAYIQYAQEME